MSEQSKLPVVFCDFYGVILSCFNWKVIDNRIKSNPLKEQAFEKLKKNANQGLIDNFAFKIRVSELAEDSKHQDKAVYPNEIPNIALLQFLEGLKDVRLAVISNGSKRDLKARLVHFGYSNLFEEIFASDQTRLFKPEKEAYTFALNSMEASKAMMIDDSQRHVLGAERAGLKGHLYTDLDSCKSAIGEFINA